MNTILLAQIIGVFFFITGLSMVSRRKMMMKVFHELFKNRFLTYLFGVFLLIVGLIIVLQHNIWSGILEIVITVLGWYLILESLGYIFLPQKIFKRAEHILEEKGIYYALGSFYLVLGAYLVYAGFFLA